jgi:hypothetical protein
MPLGPGTRLGPYEIVAPLGAGGMGEVHKAKDTRLDRTVAIKVLPSQVSCDPALRERFEREARTIAALNHPHICTLHDVGRHDGTDFLVLEHLEGQTLADRLTKGALSVDQALQIRSEIYVRPFPEVDAGRWQVSSGGGSRPLWARNGQELFYVSPDGAIMRVGVERGASWTATIPAQAVKPGYFVAGGVNSPAGRSYDIAPDANRFLMIKEIAPDQTAASGRIVVVQRFDQELKRLVPTK